MSSTDHLPPNTSGLCLCGCGRPTTIARKTNTADNIMAGQPRWFLRGHSHSKLGSARDLVNPSGLCACGCGQPAPIAGKTSSTEGRIKGQPQRYIFGHQARTSPVEYLVRSDTGCWIWQRAVNGDGYGQMRHEGRTARAYQVFYERRHGPVPKGYDLDHLCGVPACVNPDHLEVVTHAENCRRGRQTKLTPVRVRNIRADVGTMKRIEVARKYGVSPQLISAIVHGHIWRDV